MEDRQFKVLKAISKAKVVNTVKHKMGVSDEFYTISWNELPKGEWHMEKHEAIFFGDQLHSVRTYRELDCPAY